MHDRCCGNLTVNRRKIQIRNDPFPVLRSRRNVRIFTLVPTCCRNPVSYIYRRGSFSTFQGFLKFSTFMVCMYLCVRVCARVYVCVCVCVCAERQSNQKALHLQYPLVKKDRKQSITCICNKRFLNYKNHFLPSFFFKKYLLSTYFLSHLIYTLFHIHFISLAYNFARKFESLENYFSQVDIIDEQSFDNDLVFTRLTGKKNLDEIKRKRKDQNLIRLFTFTRLSIPCPPSPK